MKSGAIIFGAVVSALLLAADMAARLIPVTHELRLGVVTALIGAPFFLHLIVRTRRTLA